MDQRVGLCNNTKGMRYSIYDSKEVMRIATMEDMKTYCYYGRYEDILDILLNAMNQAKNFL